MRTPVTILLVTVLTVGACGTIRESRLNPFNWFGRSQSSSATVAADQAKADPRNPVEEVIAMDVARQPGGAIVTATGLPPTQGWWSAELVAENDGEPVDGVMTYTFVVFPPVKGGTVSTPQSREVTAAVFLSNIKLAGIRQIVVQGKTNSRSSRR
ncbi:MAG: hypothetical protein KDE03_12485 [Rhodobacteraceae bacterium]|nr:hypothetical protein [Paracoccaceae bacterium]